MLPIYHSNFIGGSNVGSQLGPRKRPSYRETSDDEPSDSRPPRNTVGKKKSVVVKKTVSNKKKGMAMRLNYKSDISLADYMVIRQGDWYSTPRDNELDDRRFWCMEKSYIYTDIYRDYKYPARPMNPMKLQYLKRSEERRVGKEC